MSKMDDLRELRVLVVDDDKFMLTLVRSILQNLGIRFITESTGVEEAFDRFQSDPPDLVITDWQMEPRDGLELVRLIRKAKDSPNHYTPIILLSGYMEKERVKQARDAGVHEIVAKPVSIDALKKRIVSIVRNPRPFVLSDTYFGPDRRRKNVGPPPGTPERRTGGAAKQVEASELKEIEDLLRK